jgi:hypothetical protein
MNWNELVLVGTNWDIREHMGAYWRLLEYTMVVVAVNDDEWVIFHFGTISPISSTGASALSAYPDNCFVVG